MSNREIKKLAERIEDNSSLALDLANELLDAKCDRELEELRASAYDYANAVDEHIRPSDSFEEIFEDILVTFYSGFCSKELNSRIPSGVRAHQERASDWIDEIEEMVAKEERRGRGRDRDRGRSSSRRDRGRSSSRRDDDRSSSRRGGRSNSRRDRKSGRDEERRSSRRTERGGFGKGNRSSNSRDEREERTETVTKYRGKKAVVFDPRKFKLADGVLVENYDDHELNTLKVPAYNKPEIEKRRIEFMDKSNDLLEKELETFDSVVDFINCTPDQHLSVGIIQNSVCFLANEEIGNCYVSIQGGNYISGIMSMVSTLRDSEDHSTIRFSEFVATRALHALELASNLYSRGTMRFGTDLLKEWEEVQQMLADPEAFETGIESQLRTVFEGLLKAMLVFSVTESKTRIEVSSIMMAVKSAGGFCVATEVAGDGILIRIQDENHPELDTVSTAGLEVRDHHFGDAWGEEGMVPLIVADSTGVHNMVISEKASAAKFLVNK